MKYCKWCRRVIRPGESDIAPWIHDIGFYICPGQSETMAEPADERWEDVYASVTPIDIHTYPDPKPIWLLDVIEFRIVVRYKGERVYTTIRKHKNELERYRGDLYSLTLDKMVKDLDEALDRFDKTGSFDDNSQA